VRAYADSSFLVKLVSREAGTEAAVAEYRRLQLPRLFYLPLHALEVENAIRQRAFHERSSLPAGDRGHVARELISALARLQRMLDRGAFLGVAVNWEEAVGRARALSLSYTEFNGARGFDLLHVAFALELECKMFLTTDRRQALVAKGEKLKVVSIAEKE
jgi:predicted nucleic acid-binding protein